jgi:CheY-like chemotaxis protein
MQLVGPRSALIVDDDPDVRALLRLVLELSTDFDCYEAADGHVALDVWHTRRPELVVLDHAMPGMTGLDVARGILALEPEQRVIMYSAYLDERIITSAIELGVRAVLSKDQFAKLVEAMTGADQDDS